MPFRCNGVNRRRVTGTRHVVNARRETPGQVALLATPPNPGEPSRYRELVAERAVLRGKLPGLDRWPIRRHYVGPTRIQPPTPADQTMFIFWSRPDVPRRATQSELGGRQISVGRISMARTESSFPLGCTMA